jgi:class 3 adenylate cyclase
VQTLRVGGPSGTVTFLFTDIEGSTALWERDAAAMQAMVEQHDGIVRAAVTEHGGVVFSTTGDGFAVAFDRAGDALSAALATQAELTSVIWPAELAVRVRIGIHTGEVQERGGDYFGPPVNRAARIMGAAPPGDILVSATTASLLGAAERGRLTALGHHELRGVPEPVELFGVASDGGDWSGRSLVA